MWLAIVIKTDVDLPYGGLTSVTLVLLQQLACKLLKPDGSLLDAFSSQYIRP